MAIISDIIEGNRGRYTLAGWELDRVFIVSELSGTSDQMMYEAVQTLITAGVSLGASHPTVTTAYAFEMNPEQPANMPNAARVTVIYRQWDTNYRYEINYNQQTEETTDYITNPTELNPTYEKMWTQYTFPTNYQLNEKWRGKTSRKMGHYANIISPNCTVRITRTEVATIQADATYNGYTKGLNLFATGEGGRILLKRNMAFANACNESGWNVLPSEAGNMWMCLGISSYSDNNGLSWQVSYVFERRRRGWQYEAKFTDPNIQHPPYDITEGNGLHTYQVYPTRNFTTLELS